MSTATFNAWWLCVLISINVFVHVPQAHGSTQGSSKVDTSGKVGLLHVVALGRSSFYLWTAHKTKQLPLFGFSVHFTGLCSSYDCLVPKAVLKSHLSITVFFRGNECHYPCLPWRKQCHTAGLSYVAVDHYALQLGQPSGVTGSCCWQGTSLRMSKVPGSEAVLSFWRASSYLPKTDTAHFVGDVKTSSKIFVLQEQTSLASEALPC